MNNKDCKETKASLLKEIEDLNKQYSDRYFYCKKYNGKDDSYNAFYIADNKFIMSEMIETIIQGIDYDDYTYEIYNKFGYSDLYGRVIYLEDMDDEYLKTFINCIKNDRYRVDIVKDK